MYEKTGYRKSIASLHIISIIDKAWQMAMSYNMLFMIIGNKIVDKLLTVLQV